MVVWAAAVAALSCCSVCWSTPWCGCRGSSVEPPDVVAPDTSAATIDELHDTVVDHQLHRAQRADQRVAPASGAARRRSAVRRRRPDRPRWTPRQPTTIYNPYVTTTSHGSAGHI